MVKTLYFHIQVIDRNHQWQLWPTYHWLKSLNIFVPQKYLTYIQLYFIFRSRFKDVFSHVSRSKNPAHIIILSVDTDVFVLGISFWNKLPRLSCSSLWFDGSYKNKYISGFHLAAESLGENPCRILPALHSLIGCDSTSRLASKKRGLKAASLDFAQKALRYLGIHT